MQVRGDPLPALNAPVTELAKCTLKDQASKDEVEQAFDELIKGHGLFPDDAYGATWGNVIGQEGTYMLLVGWSSVEVSFP